MNRDKGFYNLSILVIVPNSAFSINCESSYKVAGKITKWSEGFYDLSTFIVGISHILTFPQIVKLPYTVVAMLWIETRISKKKHIPVAGKCYVLSSPQIAKLSY